MITRFRLYDFDTSFVKVLVEILFELSGEIVLLEFIFRVYFIDTIGSREMISV